MTQDEDDELLTTLVLHAEDLSNSVEKSRAVALGGYADVWQGTIGGEKMVALKILRLSASLNKHLERIAREVKIWSSLEHENIVPLLGISFKFGWQSICMVSPWQSRGTVMDYLQQAYTDDAKGHTKVSELLVDISRGITYLHGLGPPIVHGDIKGSNVLVSDDGTALLTDFGLSSLMEDVDPGTSSVFQAGSVNWMAPERMNPEKYGLTQSEARSPASDMFSFGMTIYEILCGTKPFAGLGNVAVMLAIVQGAPLRPMQSVRCSREFYSAIAPLIEACHSSTPADRPSAPDAHHVLTDAARSSPSYWQIVHDNIRTMIPQDIRAITPPARSPKVSFSTPPASVPCIDETQRHHSPRPFPSYLANESQFSQWSQGDNDDFFSAPSTQIPESQQSQAYWSESQREVAGELLGWREYDHQSSQLVQQEE